MEKVLSFFTETLSGTTYIIVVIIAVILFFACIGYLAERSIQKKKKEEQYASVPNSVSQEKIIDPVVNDQSVSQKTVPVQNSTIVSQNPNGNVSSTQRPAPMVNPAANTATQPVSPVSNTSSPGINSSPTNQQTTQPVSSSVTEATVAIPEIQMPPNSNSQ